MKKFLSLFNRKKKKTKPEVENFQELDAIIGRENREQKDINLLIGDKIIEIKILLEYRKVDNWLDTSIAYIKLEKNGVICFPYSGDDFFVNEIGEDKALPILDKFQKLIYNQKIFDIYYPLNEDNDEFDDMQSAYLVLENNYVLEENRMSPSGTGMANMFCKSLADFEKETIENGIKMYSVKYKTHKYSS